jgi:hypothetical protein
MPTDNNQKTILPRMWSGDHIENHEFLPIHQSLDLNPYYPYEDDLAKCIDPSH